jgi:hypothetical protein
VCVLLVLVWCPAVLIFLLKVVRFIKTYYTRARVLRADPDTVAAPVQYRADLVNTEYQAAVRKLDAQYHSHIADPEERPLTRRLSSFLPVQGLVFGQFAWGSKALHDILTETAHSAAYKCWRQAGAGLARGCRLRLRLQVSAPLG